MEKINEYIESGILEAYVLGSASAVEAKELFELKAQYPEIEEALRSLEIDVEDIAQNMAIQPPDYIWGRIESEINELTKTPKLRLIGTGDGKGNSGKKRKGGQFIEVEAASSHMRLHKAWRWIFAAVFFLGKIFLAFAIYYYLENRQVEKEIETIKTELKHYRDAERGIK